MIIFLISFGLLLPVGQMVLFQSRQSRVYILNLHLNFQVFFLTGQLSLMMLAMTIPSWFQRRKSLEMEFCHPVNRRTLSRLLFTSLAIDQSFAIIPATAFSFYFFRLPQVSGSATTLAVASLTIITTFSFCYLIGATLFAFRSTWPFYLALTLGFIYFFTAPVIVAISLLAPTPSPQIPAEMLLVGLTALTLCLWAATFWLMKKTREREWG